MDTPIYTPLSSSVVRQLRGEAASAGDAVMVHACEVWLGLEEPILDGNAYETRYGGGGFGFDEQTQIIGMDITAAESAICAALRNAWAMLDD
jgi:hypothetical protein